MALADPTVPQPAAEAGTRLILQFVRSVKEVLGIMAGLPVPVGTPPRCHGHAPLCEVSQPASREAVICQPGPNLPTRSGYVASIRGG